ncbi:MAG TPA: FtsL-like putative cell division protein [Arachidicoccus soli]|nr:FtsL-like putative cell division protein [Arachidicoccus soli]HEU0227606.1 FtsL-like putative cell division protein [Arachidicoccus soli]
MKEKMNEKKKLKTSFKKMVNYDWIVKNIGFFLFLASLTILYIANGHWADKAIRDISKTNSQIKDLQFEYKTLKSELMFQTRESELVKAVEAKGLKIGETPPIHIHLEKERSKDN